ncbi:hypothetical protein ECCB7326_3260, partial [Escherichia coli CB7326]|jgi:hypothetical protein
MLES